MLNLRCQFSNFKLELHSQPRGPVLNLGCNLASTSTAMQPPSFHHHESNNDNHSFNSLPRRNRQKRKPLSCSSCSQTHIYSDKEQSSSHLHPSFRPHQRTSSHASPVLPPPLKHSRHIRSAVQSESHIWRRPIR